MNVVKPSCVHERSAITRTSSAMAPTMFGAAAAAAPLTFRVAGADSRGSESVRSPATSTPGTIIHTLPGMPSPVTSAVISGGPTAIPMLPPVEKIETPVAFRAPATAVAVR